MPFFIVSFELIVKKNLWLWSRIFLRLIVSIVHFDEVVYVVENVVASEITFSFMETEYSLNWILDFC
jgi:hypothetical protein